MRWIGGLVALLLAEQAFAFCPYADNLKNSMQEASFLALYQNCAEGLNDDGAQAKLAEIYDKGTPSTMKNLKKAIFYYQLSAENGNAYSQARLAQLYMELDQSRDGRAALHEYLDSVVPVSSFSDEGQESEVETFGGELVHPYVLLMLANEKPANKWYYASDVLSAPPFAKTLLNQYKIDEQRKKQLTREASRWKKRKLLEIASQLLSGAEYQEFVQTLYPLTGKADEFKRQQLLNNFKVKVEQKKKEDLEGAKAFY